MSTASDSPSPHLAFLLLSQIGQRRASLPPALAPCGLCTAAHIIKQLSSHALVALPQVNQVQKTASLNIALTLLCNPG